MNDNGPPPDHVVDDEPRPEDEPRDARLEENIKSRSTWLRLLFMILFIALWSISRILVLAVVVVQFFWVLLTGDTNQRLLALGGSLATYSYQIISYLTYNTEEQPFPFTDWPQGPPGTRDD
ncbi:MAG: DUF4389 domain-containing protein [Gammaproteobacteria bacterium]|nr:DUF4389 domain-containing protein [Gammaproteobacteria bacterium]MDH3506331.1 DUF4389 domain-containing protein [Gammaproteobacteria bacterium]